MVESVPELAAAGNSHQLRSGSQVAAALARVVQKLGVFREWTRQMLETSTATAVLPGRLPIASDANRDTSAVVDVVLSSYLDTGCWSALEIVAACTLAWVAVGALATLLTLSLRHQRRLQAHLATQLVAAQHTTHPNNGGDDAGGIHAVGGVVAGVGAADDVIGTDPVLRRAVLAYLPNPHQWNHQPPAPAIQNGGDGDDDHVQPEEEEEEEEEAGGGPHRNQNQNNQHQQQQHQRAEEARAPAAVAADVAATQAALVRSIEAELAQFALTTNNQFEFTSTVLADCQGWLAVSEPFRLVVIAVQDLLIVGRGRPMRQTYRVRWLGAGKSG